MAVVLIDRKRLVRWALANISRGAGSNSPPALHGLGGRDWGAVLDCWRPASGSGGGDKKKISRFRGRGSPPVLRMAQKAQAVAGACGCEPRPSMGRSQWATCRHCGGAPFLIGLKPVLRGHTLWTGSIVRPVQLSSVLIARRGLRGRVIKPRRGKTPAMVAAVSAPISARLGLIV